MAELRSIQEYTEEILQRDELRTLTNDETFRRLGEAFAKADQAQTGTIDKFGLATVLGQAGVKISKKKARELSISMSTRLHGEVCLDELVALAQSIAENHGQIDTRLLKSADHCLPQGHINPGNTHQQGKPSVKVENGNIIKGRAVEKLNNGAEQSPAATGMKRIPSCELLDQIGEMDSGSLLYQLDEYAKELYSQLQGLEIDEENKVTVAEAFADVDVAQQGKVTEGKLDDLFKACRRELPGYEIRKIVENRKTKGEVDLAEFAQMFINDRANDVANTFKTSIKEARGIVNKRNNEVEVEHLDHESYLASHAYSLAERRAFSTWLNNQLASDPDCQTSIPINVESEALFSSLSDGIVLCKAINHARPGTVDERVLNKHPKEGKLNIFKKAENIILGLNSALALGCKVVNIRPDDIAVGVPHLILGLLWQIIRHALLKNISLARNINIAVLLKPGEDLSVLEALAPEQIIMRWLNHHLQRASDNDADNGAVGEMMRNKMALNQEGEFVGNFGKDLSNSLAYINLLNQISPDEMRKLAASAIKIADKTERARAMLKMAEKLGIKPIITANDVVRGDEKLNMAFLAELFNKHNGLNRESISQDVLDELDLENADDLDGMVEEETREEETYRNWVNSLGIAPISSAMPGNVSRLYSDLRDGLYLLKIEDEVRPGVVNWSRVHKSYDKWQRHMKCMENCSYAVDIGQGKLGYSLVGINGANIFEMDRTRTLAILWQLMRSYMTKVLASQTGDIRDTEIQQWCNETLKKHGKTSLVQNFKDKDLSSAVIDLCDIISPGSVDYTFVHSHMPGDFMPPEQRLENAQLAINISRKIGAKIYASPMDLVEGKQKMILTVFVGLMSRSFERASESQTTIPV